MPSIIPALFKMHLPSLASIFTEENQGQKFYMALLKQFYHSSLHYQSLHLNMGLYLVIVIFLMRGKKLTSISAKLKKKFHVSFPKTNNFCIYTYLIALLVLKVQDLTGRGTGTVFHFCSYFYEILYLLECKMRFLPEIWC